MTHPTASQARARKRYLRETEALVASVTSDCVWEGGVCQTRRALHSAVRQAMRLPSGEARTSAVLAAMEAHAGHSCGPVEERTVGVRSLGAGSSAGPSLLDLDRLHSDCVKAAQRMVELRGGPPSEHEAALDAFIAADRAFHEALFAYTPNLRHPHASV